MKRLSILAVLLVFALPAWSETVREHDVLLTSDGIVYTVEGVQDYEAPEGQSVRYLRMTVQDGETQSTAPIPVAMTGGLHGQPALAFDAETRTLFVFWQEQLFQGLASKLLFASYRDGEWSDVAELDSVTWKLRRNLRIAVTRSIETENEAGDVVQIPQLIVHAVWWEDSGEGEFARYAMLGIEGGEVTSTDFRYLADLYGEPGEGVPMAGESVETMDGEGFRSPAILSNTSRDSVEVIFGDVRSNALRRLRIRPVLDGRLRIPIGVRGKNLRNADFTVNADARVDAVIEEETVALYAVSGSKMDYIVYDNGEWSKQRSIALTNHLSADTAVEALRRMVSRQ
jgi:hypothetical protein